MTVIHRVAAVREIERTPRSLLMTSVVVRLALALTLAGALWIAILGWALA